MFDQDFSFVEHVKPLRVSIIRNGKQKLVPINPYEGFYNIAQIAVIFGYKKATIQGWTKGQGRSLLPFRKVGSEWKVRRNDVIAYFNHVNEHVIPARNIF